MNSEATFCTSWNSTRSPPTEIHRPISPTGAATLRLLCGLLLLRAGIVYDSDPMSEAHETRHKATAVLKAISEARELYAEETP